MFRIIPSYLLTTGDMVASRVSQLIHPGLCIRYVLFKP